MISASVLVDETPLVAVASRLRQCGAAGSAATQKALRIYAYFGTDPDRAERIAPADAERVLLWGLDPHHIRIGPLLESTGEDCIDCLLFWLDHNRPQAELWRGLAAEEGRPISSFPWTPLHYHLLEAISLEFLLHPRPRTFIDIDAESFRVERHCYQPSPECDRCTPKFEDSPHLVQAPLRPRNKDACDHFRSRSLPEPKALRDRFVDYRVGIVKHMYREQNSQMLPMWGAESRLPRLNLSEIGFGRHELSRTCESVAILEALERYCGFAPRHRRVSVRNSYGMLRDQGLPVVDPRSFVLPKNEQRREPGYLLAPYSEDLVFDWIWACSWKRRSPVLIPLQFCFYGSITPAKERFAIETSSGCALGNSLEEAVLHGLFEVIERDAYMTRWHVPGSPRRIELNDPSMPQVQKLYARATAEGYELSAFAIQLEIPIPVVLAMIVDPRENAPVASYCASAAHAVAASAVMGALVEVCTSIGVYQKPFAAERDKARALYEDASLVQEMRDHVLLYSLPEALERLRFLNPATPAGMTAEVFAEQERPWRSLNLTEELIRLMTATCAVADDVLIVDQTASILQPLGLHCVKVLAPGLMPVTFGHQYRRIHPQRLRMAQEYLHKIGEPNEPALNPFPHNFP